jgi:hypothetical protein
MRKFRICLVAVIAVLSLVLAVPSSAEAASKVPKGYAMWTRAHCQSGKRVWTYQILRSPKGPHVLAYRTGGRICAFTVDGMKGRHRLEIEMSSNAEGSYQAYDAGMFAEYAGALAAPKHRCIRIQGSIVVGNQIWTPWVRRCA